MRRYLRKLRGAIKNPQRALRILWNETVHKLYVRIVYAFHTKCIFTVGETSITFDTSDSYSKEWFFPRCADGKYHEPAVTELCVQFARNTPSFVDVGAHLGYFTVLMGKLMTSRPVHAYEMDDRAYELLKKNVTMNLLGNVSLHHAAIAGKDGPVSYRRLPMLDSGESISYEGSDDPERTVAGLTLDHVFAKERIVPGVIKIDVEGAEYFLLQGATNVLSQTPVLLLEIHGKKLSLFGSTSQEVIKFLEERGYEVYEIQDHRVAKKPTLTKLTGELDPFDRNTMTVVLPKEKTVSDMLKLWDTV